MSISVAFTNIIITSKNYRGLFVPTHRFVHGLTKLHPKYTPNSG